jgi:hypothetical protein
MRLRENTANGEVEWIQNGRFENGLFFKDFSRRSGGSWLTLFSLIFPGQFQTSAFSLFIFPGSP